MIFLTKLGGNKVLINEALIETVYETPDTVILMNNGHTYLVQESMEEIQSIIIDYKKIIRRSSRFEKN